MNLSKKSLSADMSGEKKAVEATSKNVRGKKTTKRRAFPQYLDFLARILPILNDHVHVFWRLTMLQCFSAHAEFILDNPAKNVFAPSPNFFGPVKENLKKY